MAWLMSKNIIMEDAPNVHWTEETLEEILRVNAEVVDQFSSLAPGHPDYMKKGDAPVGLPIAFPDKPREAYIEKLHGPLPDALTATIVNDRIRQAVENFEPGIHQFIPTVVTMPDGQRNDSWWSMRPCHRVDAIALEHCEDVYEYRPQLTRHPDWYYYRSNEGSKMKLVIHQHIITGMAMWHDWKLQKSLFSEELGQFFIDNGIRGYRLPSDELNRSSHVSEV